MGYSNKKLIGIVGVGNGLGMEIAKIFGKNGYEVVLMGRNIEILGNNVEILKTYGINSYYIGIDVTNHVSVKEAFREVNLLEGHLEVLIYNAVARRLKLPSELTYDEVIDDLKVNVAGAVACVSEVIKYYINQGSGAIVFTGGGVALSPSLQNASMSIGKAGLRNYALNLAEEFRNTDIFVGLMTITKPMKDGTVFSAENVAIKYFDMVKDRLENEIVL